MQELGLRVVAEPFFEEPAPAFCSAFKIGEDLVATAGHCIKGPVDCKRTRLVHRFLMDGNNAHPHKNIAPERVYECKQIVRTVLEQGGNRLDYAIIRTDRPLKGVPVATLRKGGLPSVGDRLTVIGHPMGLPIKIAAGAVVREVRAAYLVASLDTYGGNSGSAVFSTSALEAGNLEVEGVLVRGEVDFEREIPCRISKRCEEKGCRGEDVTLATELTKVLGSP
jgi:V8-like Glu-specific endopeptidase